MNNIRLFSVDRTAVEEQGYSLIELMVAMVVSVLLIGGLYQALFQSQATYESTQEQGALRQQARVVMNQLTDELRMAGYDIGSAPERLVYAGATEIAFVADVDDGDLAAPCGAAEEGAAGGGAERVRYRLVGTDLLRSVDCWNGASWSAEYAGQVAATEVQNARPLFRYFDENDNELFPGAGSLSAADREAVIGVWVHLDFTDPDNQAVGDPNVDFELNTAVRLRNAGF
jgi:prepilin-type N-terminal cleavage/methylation domain-containing protein